MNDDNNYNKLIHKNIKKYFIKQKIDDNVLLFGEIILASLTQITLIGYLLIPSFSIRYSKNDYTVIEKVKQGLNNFLKISASFVAILSVFFYVKFDSMAVVFFILFNAILVAIIYHDYMNAIEYAIKEGNVTNIPYVN